MIPRVIEFLRADAAVPGIGPDSHVSLLKMNTNAWQGGTLVSLLFVDGEETPRYALRVPRLPQQEDRLAANYEALNAIASIEPLQKTVPHPVYCGRIDGVLFSLETCLHGTGMVAELGSALRMGNHERFRSLLRAGCDWVWKLHSETWKEERGSETTPRAPLMAGPLEDLAVVVDAGFIDPALGSRLEKRLAGLDAMDRLHARCHGDLNPNNILLQEDGSVSGVVDWEYSADGCALFDILTLFRIAAFGDDRSALLDGLETIWDPGTPAGAVFTTVAQRYARRADTSLESLRPLMTAFGLHVVADFLRGSEDPQHPDLAPWRRLLQRESVA